MELALTAKQYEGQDLGDVDFADIVGAAKASGEPLQHRPEPFGKAREKGNRFRTKFLFITIQLLSNDGVGLLPADGLKFAFSLFAGAPKRRQNPFLIVHVLADACAPGTEMAVGVGIV